MYSKMHIKFFEKEIKKIRCTGKRTPQNDDTCQFLAVDTYHVHSSQLSIPHRSKQIKSSTTLT